jgi:hypothetical protein
MGLRTMRVVSGAGEKLIPVFQNLVHSEDSADLGVSTPLF